MSADECAFPRITPLVQASSTIVSSVKAPLFHSDPRGLEAILCRAAGLIHGGSVNKGVHP